MSAALQMSVAEAVAEHGEDAVVSGARQSMWRYHGDLSYHCSDVQMRARALVYEHKSRRVVWETNRRYGKTRTAVVIAGEHCLRFPGMRVPYAAPTGEQVRAFVHPPMLELSTHAPDDLAPDIVNGDWVFPPLQWYDQAGNPVPTRMHGGVELARFKGSSPEEKLKQSVVATAGCDTKRNANYLRGTGTVFAVIDEARDIPILSDVLGKIIGPMLWESRSRWHSDVDPTMLVPSTPADDADHPYNAVADAAADKGAYFHATVYDCDHLSEQDIAEAIEEAGGEDTLAWKVEGLAQRVRDPERVAFVEFDKELHVKPTTLPRWFRPCVIGDGGHVDLSVFLFGFYDFARTVFVVQAELVFRKTRSDVVDEAIAAKERELWGDVVPVRRRVDAPPQVRADMNRAEWGAPPEGKPDDEREDPPHWLGVTKPRAKRMGSMQQGVNRARVLMSNTGVEVDVSCETTIGHIDNCRWNADRSEFERVYDTTKKPRQPLHHFDGAAALVYFLRDCDTANPVPRLPEGVTTETHHVPAELREDTKANRIAKALFGGAKRRR